MRAWLYNLPVLTLQGLLIILPLLFTPSSDELFEFPKMLLVYSASILIAMCIGIKVIEEKKFVWRRTPFDIPLLLFCISQLISTIFSLHPRTSFLGYYSRFNGGLASTLAYTVIFYGIVRFCTPKDLRKLLTALFIGAIFSALYAFPEHFGHSPSCLALMNSFTVDCWVQDVKSRVFGTFGQPNWLAAYLVVVLPLLVAKAVLTMPLVRNLAGRTQSAKSEGKNNALEFGIWSLVFLLLGSVLFFTQSRSGILGAFVALGMFVAGTLAVFVFQRARTQTNKRENKSMLFAPLSAIWALVVFFFLMLWIGSPFNARILAIPRTIIGISAPAQSIPADASVQGPALEVGGSESGDIRKVVWQGAIDVWKRYPIFGSGVETFAYSYFRDRPAAHNLLSEWDFLYNKAHNEFLNYLATTGIVGLVSYLFLYASFVLLPLYWFWSQTTEQRSTDNDIFLLAIASGLTGLAISNFFGFSTVVVSLLTFILPAIAFVRHKHYSAQLASTPTNHQLGQALTSAQFAAIGTILAVTLYLLLSVYKLWRADVTYALAKAYVREPDLQSGFYSLQRAIAIAPNEPTYRDELAFTAAQIAYALGKSDRATDAATMIQYSIDQSTETIRQNPAHINFYKTRVRIFLILAQLNPVFYEEALKALDAAIEKSPTDPKLVYNQAVIYKTLGKEKDFLSRIQRSLELRPIDESARFSLGEYYEEKKMPNEAKKEYEFILTNINPNNEIVQQKIASLSAQETKKK